MSLPMQVQSRLITSKATSLGLVAAHIFSVTMASRLFGISRTTFYQYRHQAEQGRLASFDCTPRVHGSAKPPQFALEAQRCAPLATNHQRGRRLACATATYRPTHKTSQCHSLHQLS